MNIKICRDCKEEKPPEEFSWRNKSKGEKQSICKSCQRIRSNTHYQKNKNDYNNRARVNTPIYVKRNKLYIYNYLKEHPCIDCGEKNPVVLDFDHVRGKKKAPLSRLVGTGVSIDTIKKEISKCVVRCSNCHRIKTAKEHGWYEYVE